MKPSMTDYGLRATKKLDARVVEIFFFFFFRYTLDRKFSKGEGVLDFKGTEQPCRFSGHSCFILGQLCSSYNLDRGAK